MMKTESPGIARNIAEEQPVLAQTQQWLGNLLFFGLIDQNSTVQAGIHEAEFDKLVGHWGTSVHAVGQFAPQTAAIQVAFHQMFDRIDQRSGALNNLLSRMKETHRALGNFTGQYGTHPVALDTLKQQLAAYSPSPDKSADVLSQLRLKYNLTDAELQ